MKKRITVKFLFMVFMFGYIASMIFSPINYKKDVKGASQKQTVTSKPTATAQPTAPPTPEPTIEPTPQPTNEPKEKQVKVNLPPDLNIPLDYDVQRYIYKQCDYDKSLYCLIIALIEHESGFKERVISNTNDYGLMQINSCNHKELINKYGNMNFLDPYDNTYCGIKIIKDKLKKFEYKNLALMVYNMGEEGARRLWRKEIYSTRYTVSILDKYDKYIEMCEETGEK